MMKKFQKNSGGQVTLTEIKTDSEERQKESTDAGVPSIQIQTLKNDQFATQKGYLGAVIKKGETTEVIPYIGNEKNLEYALVSKIAKMTRKSTPNVTLVTSTDISKELISSMVKKLSETVTVTPFQVLDDTREIPKKEGEIYLILEGSKPFPDALSGTFSELMSTHSALYFFQPMQFNNEDFTAKKEVSATAKKILDTLKLTLTE